MRRESKPGSVASPNNGPWELGVSANGKAVKFITASNSAPSTLMMACVDLTSNRWHHLVFNHGPNYLAHGVVELMLRTCMKKSMGLPTRLRRGQRESLALRSRPG